MGGDTKNSITPAILRGRHLRGLTNLSIVNTLIVSPLQGSPTSPLSLPPVAPGVKIMSTLRVWLWGDLYYNEAHRTGAYGFSLVEAKQLWPRVKPGVNRKKNSTRAPKGPATQNCGGDTKIVSIAAAYGTSPANTWEGLLIKWIETPELRRSGRLPNLWFQPGEQIIALNLITPPRCVKNPFLPQSNHSTFK